MAADLDDLKRLKVTPETWAWLQGKSHTSGRSKQEIARDALHAIAVQELDAARVLNALDPRQAHPGDVRASSGDTEGHVRAVGGRRG